MQQQQQQQQQPQPVVFVPQLPMQFVAGMPLPAPRLSLFARIKSSLYIYFYSRHPVQIAAAFCLFVAALVCLSRVNALFRKLHYGLDRCPDVYVVAVVYLAVPLSSAPYAYSHHDEP
jgi:hypothetical protein